MMNDPAIPPMPELAAWILKHEIKKYPSFSETEVAKKSPKPNPQQEGEARESFSQRMRSTGLQECKEAVVLERTQYCPSATLQWTNH